MTAVQGLTTMDATTAPEASLHEAASQFVSQPVTFTKCTGGVNNRVYAVLEAGAKPDAAPLGVLRVYNNGGLVERVRYEHEVLRRLEEKQKQRQWAFSVPVLLRAKSGLTYVPVPSMGKNIEACMFAFIPGAVASVKSATTARTAGAATALLLEALSDVRLEQPCPNPLFRQLWLACPGIELTMAKLREVMSDPLFAACQADANFLLEEIERVMSVVQHVKLPEQQIHADLHLDNFLAHANEEVTGCLDFEFSGC